MTFEWSSVSVSTTTSTAWWLTKCHLKLELPALAAELLDSNCSVYTGQVLHPSVTAAFAVFSVDSDVSYSNRVVQKWNWLLDIIQK